MNSHINKHLNEEKREREKNNRKSQSKRECIARREKKTTITNGNTAIKEGICAHSCFCPQYTIQSWE